MRKEIYLALVQDKFINGSQFVASRLVAKMVLILNSSNHIQRMPKPDSSAGPWNVRGVEKVLFMEGY
jgi:hypothetical protein